MTKSRAAQTAPHRRVERKCEKSRRNRNRNRNRNHNHRRNLPSNQQVTSFHVKSKKTVNPIQPQHSHTFHLDLPTDLIHMILTFLTIFDLITNVRAVCVDFRNTITIDNTWLRNTVRSQIISEEQEEELGLLYYSNPYKQVILFVTKSKKYGRNLNRAACKMKRRGPISDRLFVNCALPVFAHQSGIPRLIAANPPAWHEVTMACSHGMEGLANSYLKIFLGRNGLDEENMDEDGRRFLRGSYLVYQGNLIKDASRTVEKESMNYFLEEMDDYDLESAEEMFEESKEENREESEDRMYPICCIDSDRRAARLCLDPLALMSNQRGGKMARRIVRLLMDFENGVPPEEMNQCQRIVRSYVQSILSRPHSNDVEVVQFLVTNLYNVDPSRSSVCSVILTSMVWLYPKNHVAEAIQWASTVFGYDCHFVYDDWLRNRIEFAEAMVSFTVSKIDPARIPPNFLERLVEFARSEMNPMSECVVLKNEVRKLVVPFMNQFI